MKQFRSAQFAAFGLLIAAYILLRFWRLTDSCLWFDEIFSVHAAEHSWDSILSFVALDLIHPPLFYVLLKLWIGVGGESVYWLRLFPVIFSILAIIPFIALCRELKLGKWTQVVALFLFTVNGSLIKYAQEVRMYSLLMCLSLISIWLFARYFVKGKGFVALVFVNFLMVYTHYFGWFVVLSEVVLIVWFQRIKWRRIAVMFGVVFACFLPWTITVVMAASSGSGLEQNIGWMSRPGIREIVIFLFNVVEPFYYQSSSAEPKTQVLISLPFLVIIVIASSVFLFSFRSLDKNERSSHYFLTGFIAVPVIIAFTASWVLPYSLWGIRHLIIVLAPFWIGISLTINGVRPHWFRQVTVVLFVAVSVFGLANAVSQPPPEKPWCACNTLVGQIPNDDRSNLYSFRDIDAYQSWFAVRDSGRSVFRVELADIDEDKAFFLPRGFGAVERTAIDEITDTRFWIVFGESGHEPIPFEVEQFERRGYRTTRVNYYSGKFGPTVLVLVEK